MAAPISQACLVKVLLCFVYDEQNCSAIFRQSGVGLCAAAILDAE